MGKHLENSVGFLEVRANENAATISSLSSRAQWYNSVFIDSYLIRRRKKWT